MLFAACLCLTRRFVSTPPQVRAFEGWPGTRGVFRVGGAGGELVTLKVISARLGTRDDDAAAAAAAAAGADPRAVVLAGGALRVVCDDGSVLLLTSVQPPGGRAMPAAAYAAGLRGRALTRESPDALTTPPAA
jgi:methionyl-tRNA formyltransferase